MLFFFCEDLFRTTDFCQNEQHTLAHLVKWPVFILRMNLCMIGASIIKGMHNHFLQMVRGSEIKSDRTCSLFKHGTRLWFTTCHNNQRSLPKHAQSGIRHSLRTQHVREANILQNTAVKGVCIKVLKYSALNYISSWPLLQLN